MRTPFPLLSLRLRLWKGSLRLAFRGVSLKPLFLAVTGSLFLALETLIFHRMFQFLFHHLDPSLRPVSNALSLYILQLLFLVFGAMLVYSNLVTSISVYLTALDMKLLLVLPIRTRWLYIHKFLETLVRSSITLAVFMVPALVTYGTARMAPPGYYVLLPFLLGLYLLIPAAVAVPLMLILARIFPAKRLQQGLIILGLIVTTAALFGFRMLRVEEVFSSGSDITQIMVWASSFRLPSLSWLPSAWLVGAIDRLVQENSLGSEGTKLMACSVVLVGTSWFLGTPLLRGAWSRAFGTPRKTFGQSRVFQFGAFVLPGLSRGDSAMILKEMKVFARDLSRWSQIVMMVPLIGFYLLNMYLLPFRDQFRSLYFLLNLFMIAFIVAAIGARYLFPSVSWEGPALWLVRVSPYPLWRMVLIKFTIFSFPLLVLTTVLTVFSFRVLGFASETMLPSLWMILWTCIFLSALATGMGALLPKFRYEHHLEISLGPGGLLYMLMAFSVAFLFVMVLAYPIFASMGRNAWYWGNWSFSNLVLPSARIRDMWSFFCLIGTVGSLGIGIISLSRRQEFDT